MEHQLFTLLRITTPQLGSFVKDKLEGEDIEVFFTNEGLALGSEYNPDEVLLKVKVRESERAIKTLLAIHKEYDLDKIAREKTYIHLKKILVPVKLSSSCIELCRYAMQLAQKTNAEIKVLYVYPDPTLNEPEKHTTSWEKYVKMELLEAYRNAQKKLVDFSISLKKQVPKELFDSINLHYRMLKGTAQNVIYDACNRYHPDLIIMGTKSSKKESGEFRGKTLEKVLDRTHYPVLAVPVSAKFSDKEKINVMYSTNFYDTDNSALNKLLEILKPFDKKIHCIHIDLHNDTHHEEKVDELNKMLDREYSEHQIECKLFESENIIKGFDEFVEKNDIDIISMSKVKHSALYKMFHSDLLDSLVSTEKVPILIFPV